MAMKTNDNPAGVIVAREFGLTMGEIAIGVDGDDAKGRTDIGSAHHLPLRSRFALPGSAHSRCLIGRRTTAVAGDYARVVKLVHGMTETNSLKLRNAANARARAILERRDRG